MEIAHKPVLFGKPELIISFFIMLLLQVLNRLFWERTAITIGGPALGSKLLTNKTRVRQQTVGVVLSETARYGVSFWLTVADEVCQP